MSDESKAAAVSAAHSASGHERSEITADKDAILVRIKGLRTQAWDHRRACERIHTLYATHGPIRNRLSGIRDNARTATRRFEGIEADSAISNREHELRDREILAISYEAEAAAAHSTALQVVRLASDPEASDECDRIRGELDVAFVGYDGRDLEALAEIAHFAAGPPEAESLMREEKITDLLREHAAAAGLDMTAEQTEWIEGAVANRFEVNRANYGDDLKQEADNRADLARARATQAAREAVGMNRLTNRDKVPVTEAVELVSDMVLTRDEMAQIVAEAESS